MMIQLKRPINALLYWALVWAILGYKTSSMQEYHEANMWAKPDISPKLPVHS
jgi:hypothetical protein